MAFKVVGKSVSRVDAIAKVTGKAKYTDDFSERDMLVRENPTQPLCACDH